MGTSGRNVELEEIQVPQEPPIMEYESAPQVLWI